MKYSLLLLLLVVQTKLLAQSAGFTILQLNDVYEIAPLSGGKVGGMARVATIRKQLLRENPNTITLLAGDFVSPSLIGTLSYFDSARNTKVKIAGKQMIDAMNAAGVDYVTFGNHEFDISTPLLQECIDRSAATWISANVQINKGNGPGPFVQNRNGMATPMQPYAIHTFKAGTKTIRAGIIGVTLNANTSRKDTVVYSDPFLAVKNTYNSIRKQCDVVIALTHLSLDMDSALAAAVPGLHLIIGGHEHTNSIGKAGKTIIAKADANAKSVYIHRIRFDAAKQTVTVQSELKQVDEQVAIDPAADAVIQRWVLIGEKSMRNMGYDPYQKLMTATVPLDGREASIRNGSTNFTRLITNAMLFADPSVDMALFNSGSLRLDDELTGDVLQQDVLRALPFGGPLVIASISGAALDTILQVGTLKNKGNGGYLQVTRAAFVNNAWQVNGRAIEPDKTYRVLLPSFLTTGDETNFASLKNLAYCTPNAFRGNSVRNDIRDVIIAYMQSGMQMPLWDGQ